MKAGEWRGGVRERLLIGRVLSWLGPSAAPACEGEDPDQFWPPDAQDPRIPESKALCERCPVLERCRDWAIRNEDYGTWGGLTQWERGRLRARYAEEQRATSPWNRSWKRTA